MKKNNTYTSDYAYADSAMPCYAESYGKAAINYDS